MDRHWRPDWPRSPDGESAPGRRPAALLPEIRIQAKQSTSYYFQ
jgi:hypothetical protein